MGDMGDAFNEHRAYMRERKAREGIDCPGCRKIQPKRIPTRLLPGWKCKVCGYVRPRKEADNLLASAYLISLATPERNPVWIEVRGGKIVRSGLVGIDDPKDPTAGLTFRRDVELSGGHA